MGVSALFLLAALGMGLLISTVAHDQFVAGQLAIFTTFLPAFILSGFVFDIGSMPGWVQAITHVIAARYFVAVLQSVFLAGNVWSVILDQFRGPGHHGRWCSWAWCGCVVANGWSEGAR